MALQKIADKLDRLQRQAQAAGLNMLAMLLKQAKSEAERQLAERGTPLATVARAPAFGGCSVDVPFG